MSEKDFDKIARDFNLSQSRLIILNYEGCLVPKETYPTVTSSNLWVNFLLKKLTEDSRNVVLVISAFDKETLPRILSNQKLILVADGGKYYREAGGDWNKISSCLPHWLQEAHSALRALSFEYEGSHVSNDENSLRWDYQAIAKSLTKVEIDQISTAIKNLHGSNYFTISNEQGIIELRATGITKSMFIADALETCEYDFVMAMGDGDTNENVFNGMDENNCSINLVEKSEPRVNFDIGSQDEVLPFLKKLIDVNREFNQAMPFFSFSLYKLN